MVFINIFWIFPVMNSMMRRCIKSISNHPILSIDSVCIQNDIEYSKHWLAKVFGSKPITANGNKRKSKKYLKTTLP